MVNKRDSLLKKIAVYSPKTFYGKKITTKQKMSWANRYLSSYERMALSDLKNN